MDNYLFLDEYRQNGGEYIVPDGVLNSLLIDIENLQQESQKYKEVINKIKEWEQNHTILVYTKNAPRKLVGTHELLHILYDKEVE